MLELAIGPYMATFARAAAWMFSAPVVADRFVPPRVRVGLAAGVALLLGPLRPGPEGGVLAGIPAEILLGLIAGFAARLAFWGLEAAGQLLGMLLGIGFASFFDPISNEASLPTRRIALYLGCLAFLSAGGLEEGVRLLGALPLPSSSVDAALLGLAERGGEVFAVAIRAATPMLLASLVANLTAALASRAAPALNPFSVMIALFILVGLGVLLASAPSFISLVVKGAGQAHELPSALLFAR